MSKHLHLGDRVVVIAGNDRGKFGKVLKKDKDRIIVEGINVRKKHMRPTRENQKGQIIDVERPIHISNVKICIDDRPVKLKVKWNKHKEKELYYRDGKKEVVYRKVVKK